ncbi:16S rRNA (guanine(527)-N(7))-methyltransferase RsmG [Lacimonas salitolerans]|uniref:Ribosomal RNA small subunit methyltransferase G n=1 Tax=Lacimonas salitolerans TaxID=1323750 RepID=A0ABW4EK45_9RHOB
MQAAQHSNVSRETMDRLVRYVDLLEKWNPRINLVGKSTLKDAWTRHVVDSLQILALAPTEWTHWADLGSGGGFPGLVVAIAAMDQAEGRTVTLVESDQRKCAFLRTVIRETGAPAQVIAARIEDIEPLKADVISARALADLSTLLGFVQQHGTVDCTALFQKGETWQRELSQAQAQWAFTNTPYKSETEEKSVILRIQGVARV